MNEQPGHPRRKSAELDPSCLQDGAASPDGGHLALVTKTKVWVGPSTRHSSDAPGDVPALLERGWGHARQRVPVRSFHVRQIAGDEDLWVLRKTEVGPHDHAPLAIEVRTESLSERRGRDRRRPQDGPTEQPFGADIQAVSVDVRDQAPAPGLHTEALQVPSRTRGECLVERGEDSRSGLYEDDARQGRVDVSKIPRQGKATRALASPFAALSPANPPPTTTTRLPTG